MLSGTALLLLAATGQIIFAAETPRSVAVTLKPTDLLPTGNEWISLPTIRASDASLQSFNVLSMRDRGVLEVTGSRGRPALEPYFMVDGVTVPFLNPQWSLIEYWIPVAELTNDGLRLTVTYCAPPGSRAAFARLTVTNNGARPIATSLGMKASWGTLSRVTYMPVELRGERTISQAPWVNSAEVFSFITHDTQFAWSLAHPGAEASRSEAPLVISPSVDAQRSFNLAPGETAEAVFVLGVGVEEFSAAHNAKALTELIDRSGAQGVIQQAATWCRQRTRTTGQSDLDLLMNRNYLFTELYAWGKTIDTEQLVGVTSRSPLYYVSAAYWDRDAMLWSFPALLDIDPVLAREALDYALTIQLRNSGIHSRFIDGVVLEDGFQLDEGVAPILAFAAYVNATDDDTFLTLHRNALSTLSALVLGRFDPETGLYSTLQDSQDEYRKMPFLTYDNVLTWKALLDLSELLDRLHDPAGARQMSQRADTLRAAIMKHCISDKAPGAAGPIFAFATDGKNFTFEDTPPGSLLKLPVLGFISENDPIFTHTYDWLHSTNYKHSYSDQPYGLPGTARLPFTPSWSVADHLSLQRGREKGLKVLRSSAWDAGIVTEGVDPSTGAMEEAGRAFATASGYIAHAICRNYCTSATSK